MNTKAEIGLREFIISGLVLSMLVFGGVSLVSEVVSKNPSMAVGTDLKNFNDTFNKKDDLVDEAKSLEDDITSSKITDNSIFGPLASLIQGTWGYIKNTLTSIDFLKDMFSKKALAAANIPIPDWVGYTIAGIISALIAFIILSIIFRWKI